MRATITAIAATRAVETPISVARDDRKDAGAAPYSRTWIGQRRRVRGRIRRGIRGPPWRGRLLGYRALPHNRFARRGGTGATVRTMGRLGPIRALGPRRGGNEPADLLRDDSESSSPASSS